MNFSCVLEYYMTISVCDSHNDNAQDNAIMHIYTNGLIRFKLGNDRIDIYFIHQEQTKWTRWTTAETRLIIFLII